MIPVSSLMDAISFSKSGGYRGPAFSRIAFFDVFANTCSISKWKDKAGLHLRHPPFPTQ
jgi:hypothetical protein